MLIISLAVINLLSVIFLYSWSPVVTVACIVLISLNICFFMVMLSASSWVSYIMFLIFLGGLMVLFTYMCSMAPNEVTSVKWIKATVVACMLTASCYSLEWQTSFINNVSYKNLLEPMFNNISVYLLMLAIVYLLATLLVCVNLSSYKSGPIRAKMI